MIKGPTACDDNLMSKRSFTKLPIMANIILLERFQKFWNLGIFLNGSLVKCSQENSSLILMHHAMQLSFSKKACTSRDTPKKHGIDSNYINTLKANPRPGQVFNPRQLN